MIDLPADVDLTGLIIIKNAQINKHTIWLTKWDDRYFTGKDFDIIFIQAPWKTVYKYYSGWPLNLLWIHMVEHHNKTTLTIWISGNPYCKPLLHIGESIEGSSCIFTSEITQHNNEKWEADDYFVKKNKPLN